MIIATKTFPLVFVIIRRHRPLYDVIHDIRKVSL